MKIKESLGERIFSIFNNIFMFILTLVFLLPFWSVLSMSFVSANEAARRGNFILFPQHFDTSAYKILLSGGSQLYNAYKVTIFIVVVGTLVNLIVTAMMAYGLSKKEMPGRNALTMLVFITMLFGGGLVPSFLLNKYLGLVNNLWVLILPGLVSPWNMFIMRNFFMQLPNSLEEAASIDGANPIKILFSIVLPISLPVLTTIGLFYAVGYWNAWFTASIYINDSSKLPLQNLLRNIILSISSDVNSQTMNATENKPMDETLKSAMIIVSTLPIMCIYPFIQKYFVKGVMIGSIKG